ncbi:ATP-binding protein [Flavobacterium sp. ZE23DGlu08]|uniref:sensor histidine kinase n=1 Tax=Flavobacterium sp. ZE23DGlu08 TaxID=3059026 RepID=UPI00265ECC5D|nr:ATP-binding protein [Flavobacterium sp. ZE23DGlu08]WKL43905.1 ATP-binding protein [Flavobacterium sp. ZE23DGlu08]
MTDVSEKKHHEVELLAINQKLSIQSKELQRSNEELEQFAFIASHDLQEPLRMISSFMDQLKRKYSDRLDEKGLQYIHFATDGAKRMKQIILDLLLYSRANKQTDQNELINLNEIVSEYNQLRRKFIAEKKAAIIFDGLPSIETHRAPLTQIFHCLLVNALKYVEKNKQPRIEISDIEKENVWQFAIKDNGIGIDPQFYDKIFIIFQRLQNKKENDGNGIGLAIAKRSIEFLGGEIWVESEKDKGSTFYFTILKIKQLK